jgi:hypothetical protein
MSDAWEEMIEKARRHRAQVVLPADVDPRNQQEMCVLPSDYHAGGDARTLETPLRAGLAAVAYVVCTGKFPYHVGHNAAQSPT